LHKSRNFKGVNNISTKFEGRATCDLTMAQLVRHVMWNLCTRFELFTAFHLWVKWQTDEHRN